MLADPKADALGERFALPWLDLDRLGSDVRPDPKKFPEFDAELNVAMHREVVVFFNYIPQNDRPLTELIDSDYTFVNERSACIYFPNGVWEKNWFPTEAGREVELPFALEPLAPHKLDLLVFSGLDKKHSHTGDGHYAKTANFLTGLPVRKTPGKDISVGGISVDQLCAQQIGHLTPLPSIELGIDPVVSGIDTNVGYTRLYGCYISWRSPSTPVAREIKPRLA